MKICQIGQNHKARYLFVIHWCCCQCIGRGHSINQSINCIGQQATARLSAQIHVDRQSSTGGIKEGRGTGTAMQRPETA